MSTRQLKCAICDTDNVIYADELEYHMDVAAMYGQSDVRCQQCDTVIGQVMPNGQTLRAR